MLSKWYTPKEIASLPGMPSTVQGVHKRAKRENWRVRKRLGVQGPALEYNIARGYDLAEPSQLGFEEGYKSDENGTGSPQLEFIWTMAFRKCTEKEQFSLVNHLLSNGMSSFLSLAGTYARKPLDVLDPSSDLPEDAHDEADKLTENPTPNPL